MLGRRAFLKLLPATGISAKAVTAEAALAMAPALGADVADASGLIGLPTSRAEQTPWLNTWGTVERLDRNRQLSQRYLKSLPENIRSKKSWSPAFKILENSQQERELTALRNAMEKDAGLAKKVWDMLEGKS